MLDPALAGDEALPRCFNAASQRRDHAEPGDNDASHNLVLWPGTKPGRPMHKHQKVMLVPRNSWIGVA